MTPTDWQETMLGDLLKVKHGYAFKGKHITTENTGRVLVTPGNFYIGGGFKGDKFKFYTAEYPSEYELCEDDIVVTMTDLSKEGDTLGYSAKIPKAREVVFLHNQRIGKVLFVDQNIEKDFIYWLMRTKEYQQFIVGSASGTSIRHTAPSTIQSYKFFLPPLPEQRAIAEVLSSLDAKIDLLHRQNRTLEALAETLFRQWFIEEANPDWEYSTIKQYVSTIDNRGKTPPNISEQTKYPIIEVNALGKNSRLIDYSLIRKYVTEDTFNTWFRGKPKKFSTLISTVGSIGFLSMYLLEVGNIAQNIICLEPKKISPFYLYQYLKFKTEDILNLDIGGVQPSIKVPHLLDLELLIPSREKLDAFDVHALAMVEKMETNYIQIQTLERLRDALLPKLMAGSVRVKQINSEGETQ